MQRARDQFFAGSGLARDQHGLGRWRDSFDIAENRRHGPIACDYLGEGFLNRRRFRQELVLERQHLCS
jgi:hypothetical protein